MVEYAGLHEPIMPMLRLLLQQTELPPKAIVLDLASGSGEKLPLLQAAYPGARIVALDCDRNAVSRIQQAGSGAIVGDAHDLPLCNASCDIVVCIAALGLFEQPLLALNEVRRVLGRNGRALLVTAERRWARVIPWPAELANYVPQLLPAHADHAEACERLPIAAGLGIASSYAIQILAGHKPIAAALSLNDWPQIAPVAEKLPPSLQAACETAAANAEIELCDMCLAAWCTA